MGMGAIPCHDMTISLDGLKEICPQEVKACETIFESLEKNWDSFAQALETEGFEDFAGGEQLAEINCVDAWKKLQAAFSEATKVNCINHDKQRDDVSHLELFLGFYSSDDGDRYDDLEQGCYFSVFGATQPTPAGKKFEAHLQEKRWTVFG